MVYTLCKYPDETEVVFSDIRKKDNGEEYIRVSFERPTEHGFDTVVFELPSYKIIEREGNYSDEEVEEGFLFEDEDDEEPEEDDEDLAEAYIFED